jgi:glycosyltransferase involved in cell wall biosynthesis
MPEGHPRVTVGVPVFNGESFLAETLDSLSNQTFSDFEIVISDNASTDRTEQICRDYAARDPRIRYYRSDTNHGAAWNHNRVFELGRGEYFKWNSADDLCAPEFLARCVAALDEDASATMVCSSVLVIDDYGDPVRAGFIPAEVASPSAWQRFRRIIQTDHYCLHVYSLIRSDVLRKTDLIGHFLGSDRTLLSHLSLFGHCVLLPDTLMFNRDHPARFTRSFALHSREGTIWFDQHAAKRKLLFPSWRFLKSYWEVVSRSPLRWQERLQCYGTLLAWSRHRKKPLLDDLLYYPKAWLARHVSRATPNSAGSRAIESASQAGVAAQPRREKDGSRETRSMAPATVIDVTVIVCTRNRGQDLARGLESIAASKMPSTTTWEILVVDNNSTDRTREVVEDFSRRYPGRFRYLLEPKLAKFNALNSGIANARGEILAFVDDDVTVEPRWLRNLTAELCSSREWAGTAGRILPAQTFEPPPWLSWEHCGGILCGNFDLGNHPSELDLNHAPHGANMAFRRAMFENYGGFKTGLGPGPQRLPNGDTELGRRLMKAGERLRYEPSAVVYHPVAQGRLTKEYFLSWWFDCGRAEIIERGDRPEVLGIPYDYLSLLSQLMGILTVIGRWVLTPSRSMRFFWKCMVWRRRGMMLELYRRSLGHQATKATALS